MGSDKYIYKYGLRLKADKEDKYCVIRTHAVTEDGDTSGSVVKDKTAAKDGADWYYYVKDRQIKMYTDSKDLPESLKKWKKDLV